MYPQSFLRAALVGFMIFCATANGHTWVEQLSVIASNGTMVGVPGFPRGNVLRSASNFGDGLMVNLIPPNGGPANVIDSNQLMCRQSQTTQSQTNGSPRLSAAPGAMVALRYQENGHVTLPQNQPGKPANRGTNFVYYTTQSQATDKFLAIHRQWTADGSGGDGRGRLISTQNFDDSQCYQVNGSPISTQRQASFKHTANSLMGGDLWCQQDIQIPTDAKAGSTITLYWVWDWPTMPGTAGQEAGKQELYTTCMDIDIVAGSGVASKVAGQNFVKQDFVSAAASAQFADIANPTAVASPQTIPFSGATGSSVAASGSSKPTSSSAGPGTGAAFTTLATSRPSNLGSILSVQPSTPTSTVISTTASVPAKQTTALTTSVITNAVASASTMSATGNSPFTGFGQGRGSGRPNHSDQAGATVTVYNTDTPTPTSADSIATPQATTQVESIVTRTETDMITRTRFNTISARQEETSAPSSTTTSGACSKTEAVYRLRARLPFYILPHQAESSTGC